MPSVIRGQVIDNQRHPVEGVRISRAGKDLARTPPDGSFAVQVGRAGARVALTFTADGHVPNTRVYDSRADGINTVVIWPFAYRVRFDPGRELDVELGVSRIRVPENAILGRRRGTAAAEKIELAFAWFDVTDEFQRAAIAGDFSGRAEDGRTYRLDSFGAFALDLRDPKGGSPDLRPEAAIELSIGITPRLAARAPQRVGLLGFDASKGSWIQTGASFDLGPERRTYHGVVKSPAGVHMMDDPLNTTCVTVQLINPYDGSGLKDMLVQVNGSNYGFSAVTDVHGFVCLVVARNSPFSLTAQGSPYGSGSFWATPNPVTLVSPDIGSSAANCGDPSLCPLVGAVPAYFVVGRAANGASSVS
jgi:hypothetical protein